ncbi:hypothetical protein [Nocardia donostiensis]|uniref:DUF3558 domain-containing protein n=2 Tax=Nocardia donostiensis TaxID=1538463 RepID=A0A1W0BAQ1_9NOCA|nr:hypothetical protein [Nocardia donostiensis]ONM46793.1 hypothetical protein B0T46_21330 [Nocardia donostiensis]OQS16267.1 hypothetical protein B0T36_05730 [Nocardia donostiensis]OQS19587.1 hypothetical protein B0T44_13425 [Nocardia donostiensis]
MRYLGRAAAIAVGLTLVAGLSACTTTGKPIPEEPAQQGRFGEDPNAAKVAHFARIRAADPCTIAESDVLKQYGSLQKMKRPAGITQCIGLSGDQVGDVYLFYLDLDVAFSQSDAAGAQPEQIAGRRAYRTSTPNDSTEHRSCNYKVPYEGVDHALSLRLVKSPPRGAPDSPWPQACAAAAEYLESIYPKIDQLKSNPHPTPGDIMGQDPCEQKDVIASRFPGWRAESVLRTSPYACDLEIVKPGETRSYQVSIHFSTNEKPAPTSGATIVHSESMNMAGFEGVRTETDVAMTTSCGISLVIGPASNDDGEDFHLLSVRLTTSAETPPEETDPDKVSFDAPPTDCGQADALTQDVLAGIEN